jgi:hypothetical protein
MSATPRTDAAEFSATTEKPASGEFELRVVYSDEARKLETELNAANSRLAEWEKLFETTNPAQAKAEHAAVVLKRQALFNENRVLQEKLRACEASHGVAPAKPDASAIEGEHGPGA